jgi:hypothetical protein
MVDFFAYVHPYNHTLSYSTFGHHIAPMIWIRTDPMISPDTRGAIAGDYFLRDMARAGTGDDARAGTGATIVDLLNSNTNDPKKLTGFLGNGSVKDRPWRPNVFLTMPVVHLKLHSERIIGTDVKKYTFPDSFLAYSNVIRDAIHALLAANYGEAWLERYAARYQGCSAKEPDVEERDLLYKMRAIEFRFLNEQDVKYANLVAGSPWSRSLWQMREKEIGAGRKQAVFDRVFTPGLMMLGVPPLIFVGVSAGTGLQIQNAIFALLDDVASRQAEFSFALSERAEKIGVSSYNELTSRLREIYAQCDVQVAAPQEDAA